MDSDRKRSGGAGAQIVNGPGAGPSVPTTSRKGAGSVAAVVGVVTKVLPSRLYLVRLEEGGMVTAHATGRVDKNFIRVIVGDRVRLELSAAGHHRGRITEKIS